jgi:predicted metalloprotease with PDZ domain
MKVILDVTEPETHLVHVTLKVPALAAGERVFRMPAWVPGSYKIRDFGRHVQDLKARVGGKPARAGQVRQRGKDAWTITACRGKAIELDYRVYARELTVDTSHVTADHAHLFPGTLVLYDEATRAQRHDLQVRMPKGWRLWSGLETPAFDGTLEPATDYDHLLDCPIECGPPQSYHEERFTVRRKQHRMVFWQPPAGADWARIAKDVRAIVEATAKLFGGLPYEHYTFLSHVALKHGGGLEHRNSTVLGVDPLHLLSDEKLQTRFYPLVAHEFFHTWNVKRILPAAFQPYDLQKEVHTELLWLFEGFTSYYELPLMGRAGVVDDENWGKLVAEMLKYYEMALGRKRLTVAEASRLTWTLLYQPHEHNINRNVSYYTKGLFVGLCLDQLLRSKGVKDGLDAVMRHLWKQHGAGNGLPEGGFAAAVREATGVDASAAIRRWVHGTDELPIDKALRWFGWDVERDWQDKKKNLGLGVHFKEGSSSIERIPETMPSWRILQPDDEIVAVAGSKFSAERLGELAATKKEGDAVEVALFREGYLRTMQVPLAILAQDKITVKVRKGDAAATRRRRQWMIKKA